MNNRPIELHFESR